jgi:hypothetical protein
VDANGSTDLNTTVAPRDPTVAEAMRTERVAVETAKHLVTGTVTLPAHGYRARFSDHLNRQDIDYIALSEAEKTPLGGGPAESHGFLAVARKAIVFGYSLENDAD